MTNIFSICKAISRVRRIESTKKCDILLVDSGHENIIECLPSEAKYCYLPIRGEYWFINFRLFCLLVKYYFLYYRNGKVGLRGIYIAAISKIYQCRIVATFIDNNNWDKGLSEEFQIRLITIQNGLRKTSHIENKKFDILFTMYEASNLQTKHIHKNCNTQIASGSLKAGLFLEHHNHKLNSDSTKPYILFISQYRPKETIQEEYETFYVSLKEQMSIMVSLLNQYCLDNNLRLIIAMVAKDGSKQEKQEILFFKRASSLPMEFSSRYLESWSSYQMIYQSQLSIGISSTLLYETIGLDKKSLFGWLYSTDIIRKQISDTINHEILNELSVDYTNKSNFYQKLDWILSISDYKLQMKTNEIKKYLCNIDRDNLPQHQIKKIIVELINE